MSFKSIGTFISDIQKLKGVAEPLDAIKTAAEGLKGVPNIFKKIAISKSGLTGDFAAAAADVAGLAAAETGASAATVGFGAALSAAGAAAKAFFVALATNPVTYIAAGLAVALAATYKIAHAFDDAVEQAQNSASEYQSSQTELSSLNSELETTNSRIKEIQASGTISLTDEAELSKLKSQRSELENQIQLQKQLKDGNQQTAVRDAEKVLTYGNSQYEGLSHSPHQGTFNTNILDRAQTDLSKLQELQAKKKDLESKLLQANYGSAGYKSISKELKKNQSAIDKYSESLSEKTTTIQDQYDTLFSAYQDGNLSSSQIETMRNAYQVLSDIGSVNMTGTEKSLNNLNTFFSSDMGHSGIEDYLTRVAKSGGDVNEALAHLGLTAKDLGTNNKDLRAYFNDIAKAAEDASSSVQKVDGSFSGIASAFESQNGGDNLDSFLDFLSKANQLKKAGKTGTDDFQSVSTFMSGSTDIKSSLENYQKNVDYLEKYLSKDKEGTYSTTESGMKQWAKDITEVGNNALAAGKQIETTDDLAKELGTSAGVLELALSAFQDYDISTPFDNLPRAAENLEKAKAELTSLQELYDSMDAGDTKKALGESIDSFQAQIDAANGDLSKLDKDIVLNMKLTYDLAEIQAQIDHVQDIVTNSGDNQSKSENLAELIALKEQKNKILLEGMNLTEEAVITISPKYKMANDSIGKLQGLLATGKDFDGNQLSEKAIVSIQTQISNLSSIKGEILTAFRDAHPEITAETDTSVAEATFNEWINSEEGKKVEAKVEAKTDEALQQIADLMGIDLGELKVKLGLDSTDADNKLKATEQSMQSLDDSKVINLSAEDNASGTIQSVASSVLGIPENEVTNLIAQDDMTGVVLACASYLGDLPTSVMTQMMAQDNASGAFQVAVDYVRQLNTTTTTTTTTSGTDGVVAQLGLVSSAKDSASGSATVNVSSSGATSTTGQLGTVKAAASAVGSSNPIVRVAANAAQAISTLGAVSAIRIAGKQFKVAAKDAASNTLRSIANKVSGLKGKTITITTILKTIKETVFGGGGNGKSFNGTAHFNGTARSQQNSHANGTAKASGDWSLKKDQTSLINELGPEIVVRDGKWHTFNNGYPTFAKLRRGDIVFNHKQTEELLKRGYVTNSHARVYGTNANGSPTAFASGTAFADGSNKNSVDWIEIVLKRLSTALDKFTTAAENAYRQLDERTAAYAQAISQAQKNLAGQRSAYTAYMKAANEVKLSESLKARVRDGGYYVYDGYSDNEQKLIEQYKKYWEAAQDVAQDIVELDQKIAKLYTDQFSAIEKHFDNEMSMLEDYQTEYENKVSIAEARGHFASSLNYEDQLAMQQRIRDKYVLEMNELQTQLDKAVSSGAVKQWSDEWWSMRLKIEDCVIGIQKVDKSVADLQQTMRELDWDKFDWAEDRISQLTQESDFLIDLLDGKKTVNDDGSFTDEGNAIAGLHAANYATYTHQARDYADAIKKIDAELANDPSNQNLVERREKLLELQQKAIKSAKDEKDAIGDLIEDGIKKQQDAFKDLVDSYQDALDSAKDLYDYQKKIASATEKVSTLEKQLNAYSGDDSEETRATIQKLQKELKEAQEDLEDTEYDQYVSDLKKLTDQLQTEHEDFLNARLDDLQAAVDEFINSSNINSSEIMDTLNKVSGDVGYTISDTLTKSFNTSTNTLGELINNVDISISTLASKIESWIRRSNSALGHITNIKKALYQPSKNTTVSGKGSKSKNYKAQGYANGGFIAGLKKVTFDNGDDMITVNTLKKGEAVLTPEQTRILTKIASVSSNLYDAALSASTIPSLTKMLTAQPSSNLTSVEVPNINVTFSLPNVTNYQEFMNQMQKDKQYERMMKDMVLGCISGKNSLSKNNYHWK